MASITVAVLCPYCQSDGVVKNDSRKGKQLYKCNGCRKQFRDTGATNGHKMPADHIGAAIQDYYAGKSYKAIAETMALEYDIPEPSKASHCVWGRRYRGSASSIYRRLCLWWSTVPAIAAAIRGRRRNELISHDWLAGGAIARDQSLQTYQVSKGCPSCRRNQTLAPRRSLWRSPTSCTATTRKRPCGTDEPATPIPNNIPSERQPVYRALSPFPAHFAMWPIRPTWLRPNPR